MPGCNPRTLADMQARAHSGIGARESTLRERAVQMEAPFTRDAFLHAPIFLLLQVESIVDAAKASLADGVTLARHPDLLPAPPAPHAATPRLGRHHLQHPAAIPIVSEPSSAELPKPSAAIGPAVQLNTPGGTPVAPPIASDKDAQHVLQPAAAPSDQQRAGAADECAADKGESQPEVKAEAPDASPATSALPQLHASGASAFATDPTLRRSLCGASSSAELARQASDGAPPLHGPTLREAAVQAELQWPRLLAAPGCAEVHLDIHGARQRMARAFVSTRSLSDSHSIFITLANDPGSRVPLAASASARMIGRFKAAGRIVRPLPSQPPSVPPPMGLNKFASLASIATASPSLASGLPSLSLGSLANLRLPLTTSPGGTPAVTPRSTPTASLLAPTPPPLEATASTAADSAMLALAAAPPPAGTAAAVAAEAAARALERVATPAPAAASTATLQDAPQQARSGSAADSAADDGMQGQLADGAAARPNAAAPALPSMAATASALGLSDELRDIAMQCLAIPDESQRRPPIPYAASHLPSSQDATGAPLALRQPDAPPSLRQAPMLVAEALHSVPQAPSWRQGSRREAARRGGSTRSAPARDADTDMRSDVEERGAAGGAASRGPAEAAADQAMAGTEDEKVAVEGAPLGSVGARKVQAEDKGSCAVGNASESKVAAAASAVVKDGDGGRAGKQRSDGKTSREGATPKRKR